VAEPTTSGESSGRKCAPLPSDRALVRPCTTELAPRSDLWLAGYSNWRLATIDELQDIYDANRETPGLAGLGEGRAFTWHVEGGLLLSGDEWSSSRNHDERGHPSGNALQFDFNDGRRFKDDLRYHAGQRALCVRRSDVVMAPQSATEVHGPAQDTQARGYWVDPFTDSCGPEGTSARN
jgi:hypothetical protein